MNFEEAIEVIGQYHAAVAEERITPTVIGFEMLQTKTYVPQFNL